jgi:predicted RNase H-like HicB family nuclease
MTAMYNDPSGELKRMSLNLKLTAVYRKVPEGYIGFVSELPGANTQAPTLEGTKANLEEAIALVLEANRAISDESIMGQEVIREPLTLSK